MKCENGDTSLKKWESIYKSKIGLNKNWEVRPHGYEFQANHLYKSKIQNTYWYKTKQGQNICYVF